MAQPHLTFVVRPLAAADRMEWERLWQGYLSFYETVLPAAVTHHTVARLLDPAAPLHGFVAEARDVAPRTALLGLAHCVLHEATWSLTPYCYLEDLFVTSEARGVSVGAALIEAAAAFARSHHAGRLYWLTHETNATARKLYDRLATRSGFLHYRKPL